MTVEAMPLGEAIVILLCAAGSGALFGAWIVLRLWHRSEVSLRKRLGAINSRYLRAYFDDDPHAPRH